VLRELGMETTVPADEVEIRLWQEGFAWVRTLDRFRSTTSGIQGERVHFIDLRSIDPSEAMLALNDVCGTAPIRNAGSVAWCRPKLRQRHDGRLFDQLGSTVLWDLAHEHEDGPVRLPHEYPCDGNWPCFVCVTMDGRSLSVEIFSRLGDRTGVWSNPGVCCRTPRCLAAEKVLETLDGIR